ncbi:MAG: kelch repeat-containing protein [Chloroflexota bacterium]
MRKVFVPLIVLTLLLITTIPILAGEVLAAPRWRQVFPPTSPPVRGDHAMTYDTARGVAVLFGGYGNGTHLDDTWEWNSASMSWVERQPAHKPAPRYGYGMAYDEARGITVLFGGAAYAAEFGDTWLWDGEDWTEVFPADAPSPRWLHNMVYDQARQRVVLFGGEPTDGWYSDETWEWDGLNWVLQDIASPSPRHGVGLAYDSLRGVTVLFGGDDSIGWQSFNDTWERAGGGDWVQLYPSHHPSKRERMAAAYLPELQQMVVFGGLGDDMEFEYLDDTMFWNGQQWRTRTFNPRPAGRCCTAMVYDPLLHGLLLFGGSVSWVPANDTWIFR